MDIVEFAAGIVERERAKEYLSQSKMVELPGRSFNVYYRDLLPPHFCKTDRRYRTHVLFNFAVQALAVRAAFGPNRCRYLYCGSSADDFGASLLGAMPNLRAHWLAPEAPGIDQEARVHSLLSAGHTDDLKQCTISTGNAAEYLSSVKADSLGLIIVPGMGFDELRSDCMRALSPGGAAIIYSHTDGSYAETILEKPHG